jgi:flagellar biosynthetic protein FliR
MNLTGSAELASFSSAYVTRYVLALVRVLGALSLNPLLGSGRVPLQARIGLGLFTTLALFPPGSPVTTEVELGPLEIAGELLLGLLAGFVVALIFAAVQVAANIISINAGFGFATSLDPTYDLGSSGLERFFSAFALLIFVQINGHHLFLAGLHQLFVTVDVGAVTLAPGGADRLAELSAGLFLSAVKMALPVLAALMLTDLGMAILARVAPQFNLFALGMPVKVAVGLAALGISLPIVIPRMVALFRGMPEGMLALVG